MAEWLQVVLLALLVIILYIISSRWRRVNGGGRVARITYWIAIALVALILALIAVYRGRNV